MPNSGGAVGEPWKASAGQAPISSHEANFGRSSVY